MNRSLPPSASLDQLKRQARDLQRLYDRGDAEEARRVEHGVPGFTPSRATPGELPLTKAQAVIAREYGFASWPKLRAGVAALASQADADAAFERDDRVAFFAAVHDGKVSRVRQILEQHPEYANARIDSAHWALQGRAFVEAITAAPPGAKSQTALHRATVRGDVRLASALREDGLTRGSGAAL